MMLAEVVTPEELMEIIKKCDGAEVPRDSWPVAEQLRAAGLITLSAARGPNKYWKRAEVTGR